jgi:Pectate lyase superfamily protein
MSLTKATFSMISGAFANVKDFGAAGDGVTDDTAAIQAAINYAQNNISPPGLTTSATGPGCVYFPAGAYKVTDELLVTYKISVLGEGQSEYSYGSRLFQTTVDKHLFNLSPTGPGTSFSIEKMVMANTAGVGTGNLVNILKTSNGVNSQRYVDCTFAQPQKLALCLTGDDIAIANCLFDVSTQSNNCIQLGGTVAGQATSNVRVTGCDFFHIPGRIFALINVSGLTVSGCNISQPNATTKTQIVFDAQTDLVSAKNIAITGNAVQGARTLFASAGVENVTISGNTLYQSGAGTGETQSMFNFSGINANVNVNGNTCVGSYDTSVFWQDSAATSIDGYVGGNVFQNTGGAGNCFASGLKFAGSITENRVIDFVNYQISGKATTTGNAVNPGTISSLSIYQYTMTVVGAEVGDFVTVNVNESSDFLAAGITLKGFVSSTNTVQLRYSNNSSGAIAVSAHDVNVLVTR